MMRYVNHKVNYLIIDCASLYAVGFIDFYRLDVGNDASRVCQ